MVLFAYHSLASLTLIVCQTTIFARSPIAGYCYDLLIPFIIYICLYTGFKSSVFYAIFLGLVVDSLSGAVFGSYLVTYIWIVVGMSGLMKIFQIRGSLLLPILLSAGVLFEDLVVLFTLQFSGLNSYFEPAMITRLLVMRAVIVFFTGHFVVTVLLAGKNRLEQMVKSYTA